MKRYGNLYEEICGMENIEFAHQNARKGKSHYREVKMIDREPGKYLNEIHLMLKNKTYRNSKYEIMERKMNNGKIRKIYKLPYFPDRIIHHAIMQIVGQIWYKTLIRDTYSSVKGRGIHDAVKRIKEALRDKENTKYCLKLDVTRFYPGIDNNILKQIIRKKIKDTELLWLIDEIVDSTDGVPIGNYLSQYFGNIYLSEFDHYMKEMKNCKYYFRYCDDVVILHSDKAFLHELRQFISEYLHETRSLTVKDNWQIFPIDKRGIDFLGYRFFHDYVLLRRSIKDRLVRKIRKINKKWRIMRHSQVINSIMSYYGWVKYANCRNLMRKYINKDIFWIIKQKAKCVGIRNPLQGRI